MDDTKYEYKWESVEGSSLFKRIKTHKGTYYDVLVAYLNTEGKEGWRLLYIDNLSDVALFGRKIKTN